MATDRELSGLLDALRAEGEVDSQGRFTLDRAQARAKMQKFQLADPRRYVLELVQAAVLRGATAIAFEIDADDMRMRFDGQAFTAAELDDLWGSIFADGEGPELRGLRQLALGLNAALGLDPKRIVVHSGDQRLTLRPGRDDALEASEAPLAGTTIHVRRRLGFGVVVAFFRDLGGRLGEEIHLRERCRHAPVPITLDGASIVRGLRVEGALAEQPLAAPGVRGVIALVESAGPAELRLLKDGVWIDTHPLEQCGPGLVAAVEGDALRKDVSLAKIVADEALGRIVGLVRVERWGTLARLVEAVQRGEQEVGPAMSRVRQEVLQFLRLRDIRKRPDAALVARAVVWPDARSLDPGGAGRHRWITLAELADLEPGALRFADLEYPSLAPEGPPIPRLKDAEAKSLARLLGNKLTAADDALKKASDRERARRAWLERAMDARLSERESYLVRAPIEGPGLRGELGIAAAALAHTPRSEGTTWLLREGRLLTRLDLSWGVAGLDVVLAADFEPGENYDDVVRDAELVRAGLHVLAGLAPALARLERSHGVDASVRGLIKAWLALVLDDEARAGLWRRLGVPEARWPDAAARAAILPAPAAILAAGGPWAPLLDAPLFEDFDGARRSLRALGERVRRVGAIDELDRSVAATPGLGREVAWLGRGDRRILAGLFGEAALRSWEPVLKARLREREFRAGSRRGIAEITSSLHAELAAAGRDPALWSRTVGAGGVEAVLALSFEGEGEKATIELLYDERTLATRTLDLGLGPIVGAASSPGLRPAPGWDDVADDAALQAVVAALREAAWELVGGLVRRLAGLPNERSWLTALVLDRLARPDGEVVLRRWPDLPGLPLLVTVDGGSLSLRELDAVLQEHGRIEWVAAGTPDAALRDPPILREDPRVIGALRRRVGADRLLDGQGRLRRQGLSARLSTLPAIERVELDPARVLFSSALDGQPRLDGQIGLSRARGEGGLELELCTEGRRVGVVTQADVAVPVEAILADPELPLTPLGAVDQRSKRLGQHLRRCRRAIPGLVVKLCERFPGLPSDERERARVLLLRHAEAEAGAESGRGAAREQAWQAVRALPLLVDVTGKRRTLAEVESRCKKSGRVDVVSRSIEVGDLPPERLILVVDPPARRCLAAMVRVRDLDDRWEEELAALRGLARAPEVRLPDLREVALVDRKATVAGGLQAHLWIPRRPGDGDALVFVREKKEVGRLALIAELPCAGLVTGDGLVVGARGLELDERQRSSLARQICVLYEALAGQVKSGGRMNAEERERALSSLVHVDRALERTRDPLLAGLGKPLERLREQIAAIVPPALRRARTREGATREGATGEAEAREAEARELVTREAATGEAAAREGATREAATREGATREAETREAAPARVEHDPEQRLLRLVRAELEWARARHGTLLDRLGLDRLSLGESARPGVAVFDRGLVLQRRHPLVARPLEELAAGREPDPIELTFIVSAVYTVMNAAAVEIDATDEQAFVARLAESLALALAEA